MRHLYCFIFFCLFLPGVKAQQGFLDTADLPSLRKQAYEQSQVMQHAFYLTDVSGPRLTGSDGFDRAASWVKEQLTHWGLQGVRDDYFPFPSMGWRQEKCYLAQTAPYYQPLIAVPFAWTGSTSGAIESEVVGIKAQNLAELAKYKGRLKGKVVMLYSGSHIRPAFTPDTYRYREEDLQIILEGKYPILRPDSLVPRRTEGGPDDRFHLSFQQFLIDEGAALLLQLDRSQTDGTLIVGQVRQGAFRAGQEKQMAQVKVSGSDFLRMQRLLQAGQKVRVEAEVKNRWTDIKKQGYNLTAEITGTDPQLKDEVVMLGAHLDSWHGATGATDNAAGCAVVMEAVRILAACGLKPRRTIRIALWGGEEQGLIGSREYVAAHIRHRERGIIHPQYHKISAYYNMDYGAGRIRGIYAQGNREAAALFAEWLVPFRESGAGTVTLGDAGGTDHSSFNWVNIPAFQFIQDPLAYYTRTHHSNMDTYDRLIAEDLQQSALILAWMVYQTAQHPQRLPRKR